MELEYRVTRTPGITDSGSRGGLSKGGAIQGPCRTINVQEFCCDNIDLSDSFCTS
jgi:hypothetical protein